MGLRTSHRDRLPSTSRYEVLVKIASGGMGTVYVGRLVGVDGFRRYVAIKRAHAHLLEDASFRRMLITEARLAAGIHHPNVVAVHDVEELDDELVLVMDYVEGASLADLLTEEAAEKAPLPAPVGVRILLDLCAGLQAAHDLTDESGRHLGLVHRDVSPQNILVGIDGVARLTDFGVAKPTGQSVSGATTTGLIKGKMAYVAPEYAAHGILNPSADVYALGVVAWEALTRSRLFRGATDMETLHRVVAHRVPLASSVAAWLDPALDPILMKALAREPSARFASARELAEALEQVARRLELVAGHADVAKHVDAVAGPLLEERRAALREASGIVSWQANAAAATRSLVVARGNDEETKSMAHVAAGVAAAWKEPHLASDDAARVTVAPRAGRVRRVSRRAAAGGAGLVLLALAAGVAVRRRAPEAPAAAPAAPVASTPAPPDSAPPSASAPSAEPASEPMSASAPPPPTARAAPRAERPTVRSSAAGGAKRAAPAGATGAPPSAPPASPASAVRAPPNPYRAGPGPG